MSVTIHEIPLTFQEVDDENTIFGGCNKSYKQLKQEWTDYLNDSEAVKRAATKIEKMHIGTLAHFYFKDSKIPFQCDKYEEPTTIDRCENCSDWFRPDNICQADAMGAYIEKQPRLKDIALDTMHIVRVTLK